MLKEIWSNKESIISVIAYVIAIASIIVKFTPSPKDDTILAKIKEFLSKYIAVNPTSPK